MLSTGIDSILEQLYLGRRIVWAKATTEGRRLAPVRAFYEKHMTERVEGERTGRTARRQCLLRLPGARAFLLASVREGDRFSIVTTAPNANTARCTATGPSPSDQESQAYG